jgi:hypothetical protein
MTDAELHAIEELVRRDGTGRAQIIRELVAEVRRLREELELQEGDGLSCRQCGRALTAPACGPTHAVRRHRATRAARAHPANAPPECCAAAVAAAVREL